MLGVFYWEGQVRCVWKVLAQCLAKSTWPSLLIAPRPTTVLQRRAVAKTVDAGARRRGFRSSICCCCVPLGGYIPSLCLSSFFWKMRMKWYLLMEDGMWME